MLRVQGSPLHLGHSWSRRDWLQAGGLGLCGLSLPRFLEATAQAKPIENESSVVGFGRAKQCIFIYLYGASSQLETFDMKPQAPVEIRGTMKPIASVLPGLDVCEHLPHIAGMTDRLTIVRSVTHPYPIHGVAFATTGIPAIDAAMELAPRDPRHHPFFGSVVQYLDKHSGRKLAADVPQNVALPFAFSSQRTGEVHRAGPYATFLGPTYNPTWTEFRGEGTRAVLKTLNQTKLDCKDPYLGCTADSHFQISSAESLPEMSLDRLERRRSLLTQFDAQRVHLENSLAGRALTRSQDLAFSILTSSKVSTALDVRNEPASTRELYGQTLFGQGCLAARRMIEAGTRLVSVFWDEYGLAGDAWDTHWNHYPRMVDQLLPSFDRGLSGLVLDLERRGMLDDTLVAVITDHGRTPKLNSAAGGGRDHWSQAYTLAFAGGGTARGKIVGATDKEAGTPVDRPVSPKDILATMYHLLGIDPHTRIPDRAGGLVPIVPESSTLIPEMLA